MIVKFKRIIVATIYYLFRIFPINKNKIVVSSYMGKGYGGEGKVIVDELLKNDRKYDIVWLCSNINDKIPNGVRYVKIASLRSIYEQVTAHIWIDNQRKPGYVRKRKGQYYIQTWHGEVCIKHVEKDACETLSEGYIYNAKNDSRMADLFVSGSEWRTNNFKNAFWYSGEILKANLYDSFVSENFESINTRVRNALSIDFETNIVVYAPTFRKDHRMDCYDIDYERLVQELEHKNGGKWCIIVRLHPNMTELNSKINYSQKIINGSYYAQINDLIYISKILISDYSGVIFAGYKYKKQVLLYASDYERYIKEERGLYFDFQELPSPLARNNNELIEVVNSFDEMTYEINRKKFVQQFGYYNEDGAKLVVQKINNLIS